MKTILHVFITSTLSHLLVSGLWLLGFMRAMSSFTSSGAAKEAGVIFTLHGILLLPAAVYEFQKQEVVLSFSRFLLRGSIGPTLSPFSLLTSVVVGSTIVVTITASKWHDPRELDRFKC